MESANISATIRMTLDSSGSQCSFCWQSLTETGRGAVAAVNERWLQKLREFLSLVGSQNKLAKMLGVSRPYLGRVLSGEKPITVKMIERLGAIRI
jgi:hypothetical protein